MAILVSVFADVAAVLLAFAVSYWLYAWSIHAGIYSQTLPPTSTAYAVIAYLFALMTVLVFWHLGLYAARASLLNLWEIRAAVKGLVVTTAFLFGALFFLNLHFSRLVVCGSIVIATALVVLERRALSFLISETKIAGRKGKRILIFGCGETGRLVMKKIVQAPHLGSTVVGFLDDRVPEGSPIACRLSQTGAAFIVPVLGQLSDLGKVVKHYKVDELLITGTVGATERLFEILEAAGEYEVDVAVVPDLAGVRVDQLKVDDLSAIPILRPYPIRSDGWYRFAKRSFDLALAIPIGVLTAPMWLLIGPLIRIGSQGSILFCQERIGLKGKPFTVYKFRTMRMDTDPYEPSPDGDGDERITGLGRFLRATGLDELPQVINVLRGEMSLVGPRPEMAFNVEGYTALERKRLEVKPGITGLWQISADRHAQIHENIEYDLYYLNHRSFLLDVLILLETLFITLEIAFMALRNGTWTGRREINAANQEDRPVAFPLSGDTPEPYVLFAIDTSRKPLDVESWRTWLRLIESVSGRCPVRFLIPSRDAVKLDSVMKQTRRQHSSRRSRVSAAAYANDHELNSLVSDAELVVTDMERVKKTAVEHGVDTLVVVNGTVAAQGRKKPDSTKFRQVSRL